MVVIVDYGMGNLGSIANMLKRIGATATIASNADEIIRANKLILPGIGAFDAGMRELRVRGLDSLLTKRVVDSGTPNMGWNCVRQPAKESLLLQDLGDAPRFYFMHSYHLTCHHAADALFTTHYGCEFTSAIEKDNIIGVQFHPEKSHKFGMGLLRNFVSAR